MCVSYAARLARLTGHPVSTVSRKANFHVFFAGKDDSAYVVSRLRQLIPNISQASLELVANPPLEFRLFCLCLGHHILAQQIRAWRSH